MKIILKTLAFCLCPKLEEIINTRDRLYKENIELRENLENLVNLQNRSLGEAVIKSPNFSQYSDADFSVKVFDLTTIPGKN